MAAGNDDAQIAVVVYLIGGDEDRTLAGRNLERLLRERARHPEQHEGNDPAPSLPCGKT
jgi:hypothetical protein